MSLEKIVSINLFLCNKVKIIDAQRLTVFLKNYSKLHVMNWDIF